MMCYKNTVKSTLPSIFVVEIGPVPSSHFVTNVSEYPLDRLRSFPVSSSGELLSGCSSTAIPLSIGTLLGLPSPPCNPSIDGKAGGCMSAVPALLVVVVELVVFADWTCLARRIRLESYKVKKYAFNLISLSQKERYCNLLLLAHR